MTKIIRFTPIFNFIVEVKLENNKIFKRKLRFSPEEVLTDWGQISDNNMGITEYGSHLKLWDHFLSQVDNPLYADKNGNNVTIRIIK